MKGLPRCIIDDLKVDDKILFAEEKQRYTVQARNDRFIICTKPFNPRKTFLILDLLLVSLKDYI